MTCTSFRHFLIWAREVLLVARRGTLPAAHELKPFDPCDMPACCRADVTKFR